LCFAHGSRRGGLCFFFVEMKEQSRGTDCDLCEVEEKSWRGKGAAEDELNAMADVQLKDDEVEDYEEEEPVVMHSTSAPVMSDEWVSEVSPGNKAELHLSRTEPPMTYRSSVTSSEAGHRDSELQWLEEEEGAHVSTSTLVEDDDQSPAKDLDLEKARAVLRDWWWSISNSYEEVGSMMHVGTRSQSLQSNTRKDKRHHRRPSAGPFHALFYRGSHKRSESGTTTTSTISSASVNSGPAGVQDDERAQSFIALREVDASAALHTIRQNVATAALATAPTNEEVDRVVSSGRRGSTSSIFHPTQQTNLATNNPSSMPSSPTDRRDRWIRGFFFSRRNKRYIRDCKPEIAVFLFQWYPRIAQEMLVSPARHYQTLQKTICQLLVSKLWSNGNSPAKRRHAFRWALESTLWRVLRNEFTSADKDFLPLRGNTSASFLLAQVSAQPECRCAIGSVLDSILNSEHDNRQETRKVKARRKAAEVLDALLEFEFHEDILKACQQIGLLVKDEKKRISMIGGCFVILRYVNHYILEGGTNEVRKEIAKNLQAACNFAAGKERLLHPSSAHFLQTNAPKVAQLVKKVTKCASVSSETEMEAHIERIELLMDLERCIYFEKEVREVPATIGECATPEGASTTTMLKTNADVDEDDANIFFKMSELRVFIKSLWNLQEDMPRAEDRAAIGNYVGTHQGHLQAFLDDHDSLKDTYVAIVPCWAFAPPSSSFIAGLPSSRSPFAVDFESKKKMLRRLHAMYEALLI